MKEVQWANPHIWIQMIVETSGQKIEWSIEAAALAAASSARSSRIRATRSAAGSNAAAPIAGNCAAFERTVHAAFGSFTLEHAFLSAA